MKDPTGVAVGDVGAVVGSAYGNCTAGEVLLGTDPVVILDSGSRTYVECGQVVIVIGAQKRQCYPVVDIMLPSGATGWLYEAEVRFMASVAGAGS